MAYIAVANRIEEIENQKLIINLKTENYGKGRDCSLASYGLH